MIYRNIKHLPRLRRLQPLIMTFTHRGWMKKMLEFHMHGCRVDYNSICVIWNGPTAIFFIRDNITYDYFSITQWKRLKGGI